MAALNKKIYFYTYPVLLQVKPGVYPVAGNFIAVDYSMPNDVPIAKSTVLKH